MDDYSDKMGGCVAVLFAVFLWATAAVIIG